MSTQCYAMVRGSSLRVTGLRYCGSIPDEIEYVVSRCVSRIRINEVIEPTKNDLLRNDVNMPRLRLTKAAQTIRFKVDIDFLRVDPGILHLVTGVPLVEDVSGNVVGFDANTRIPAAAFALEVWSKLTLASCGGGRKFGYTLFPFLKGGYLSGFAFENGLVSFNLRQAQTRSLPRWETGPYSITTAYFGWDTTPWDMTLWEGTESRLFSPVSPRLHWRQQVVDREPVETCGIQTFEDVIDNGNASDPQGEDILDGGSANFTTNDSVSGGWA